MVSFDLWLDCLFKSLYGLMAKLLVSGPFCCETTENQWIPCTKGQYCSQYFHALMLSCKNDILFSSTPGHKTGNIFLANTLITSWFGNVTWCLYQLKITFSKHASIQENGVYYLAHQIEVYLTPPCDGHGEVMMVWGCVLRCNVENGTNL